MPLITSKFPGTCKVCGKRYNIGDRIFWTRSVKGAIHDACHANGKEDDSPKDSRGVRLETKKQAGKLHRFEWPELKEKFRAVISGERVCKRGYNQTKLAGYLKDNLRSGFHGYKADDVERWLNRGFQLPSLDMQNPPISIREKRRLRFNEEEGEFHIDLAYSGVEEHFSEWTKREMIPGLAIEAEIGFSAATSSETLADYFGWLCRSIYALETAGIDLDISIRVTFHGIWRNAGNTAASIRVKRENEATDFQSFSAMFSPASLRSFGFGAMILFADANDRDVVSTMGMGDTTSRFGVEWNPEEQKLRITAQYHGAYSFPEERMTEELGNALKKITEPI